MEYQDTKLKGIFTRKVLVFRIRHARNMHLCLFLTYNLTKRINGGLI